MLRLKPAFSAPDFLETLRIIATCIILSRQRIITAGIKSFNARGP